MLQNQRQFKPGDKVKLVVKGKQGWESQDWAERAGIKLGDIVTVKACSADGQGAFIGVEGFALAQNADRFELVEEKANDKLDAYIKNGTLYIKKYKNEPEQQAYSIDDAYQYTLMSEADFKKKYPDNLKFHKWDVTVTNKSIKVGCVGLSNKEAFHWFSVCRTITKNDISILDAYNWAEDNYDKLFR
jgi:hypothetical protein